ncbi:hypothetical protein BpHYR1_021232, partial [Brachionus plicatilis]
WKSLINLFTANFVEPFDDIPAQIWSLLLNFEVEGIIIRTIVNFILEQNGQFLWFLLKSTQKDFTQELKNLIQEKFPEELHETITFYKNKDFKKFIEI